MTMTKELTMSKLLHTPKKLISAYLTVACTTFLLGACADTRIVTLDDTVKQQHNLIDYDSDGVIKAREKCDETTLGALVDNDGCGTKISNIEPFKVDIQFENNASEIPASAYSEIRKLAEVLEKYPSINVLIEGHTSRVGSAALNQALSNKRAQSVVLVLKNDFHINENRISAIGYGFEKLKVAGDTEQAHAANRRIMAEVSHTDSIDELKWTIYTVDQVH